MVPVDIDTLLARAQQGAPNPGVTRRYACDRCRGHKLRCDRDPSQPADSPCRRCQKAGAQCNTGPSSRAGRPRDVHSVQRRGVRARNIESDGNASWAQPDGESPVTGETWQNQDDNLLQDSMPWMDMMEYDQTSELRFGDMQSDVCHPDVSANIPLASGSPNNESVPNHTALSFPVELDDNFAIDPSLELLYEQPAVPGKGDTLTAENLHNFTNLTADQSSLNSSPPEGTILDPARQKEACIRQLTELSAELRKDASKLRTCQLACSFLFTSSDKETAKDLFQNVAPPVTNKDSIGKMFAGSEKFVKILDCFKRPIQVSSEAHLNQSIRDETNVPSDLDSVLDTGSKQATEERFGTRYDLLQSRMNQTKSSLPTPASMSPSESTEESPPERYLEMDIAATLAILNCYICILKMYDMSFSCLDHFLEYSQSAPVDERLPPPVADLYINGYHLGGDYQNLQIKIVIEVSKHMLGSIENSLGLGSVEGKANDKKIATPTFIALLQPLLKQEGLGGTKEEQIGTERIRQLVQKAESILNL